MSLGLVVFEKKLFTRTRTPTPQSDKKQAISARERGLCQLTVCSVSFRVEVTEEKPKKLYPGNGIRK